MGADASRAAAAAHHFTNGEPMTTLEHRVLDDGCEGDSIGLAALLADGYEVLHAYHSDEGYGHHSYDEIIKLADGRIVHAECGGCSCEGSGSWSIEEDVAAAAKLVPEHYRDEMVSS